MTHPIRRLLLTCALAFVATAILHADDPWVVDFEGDEVLLNLNPATLPEIRETLATAIARQGPVRMLHLRFGPDQSIDAIVRTMFDFHELDIEAYTLIATASDGTRTTLIYDRTGTLQHTKKKPASD